MEIKFSQLGKNNLQANRTHLLNAEKIEEKKDMRSTAIVQVKYRKNSQILNIVLLYKLKFLYTRLKPVNVYTYRWT